MRKSCLDCITAPVQSCAFRASFLGCWFWDGFQPKHFGPQRQNVASCQQLCRLRYNVRRMISHRLCDEFFFSIKYAGIMCFTWGLGGYIKLWVNVNISCSLYHGYRNILNYTGMNRIWHMTANNIAKVMGSQKTVYLCAFYAISWNKTSF